MVKWTRYWTHAKAVAGGEQSRQRMQRTGVTFGGARMWSEDEIAIVVRLVGMMTYKDMSAHLPGRSIGAIADKARKMRLVTKQPRWSDADISNLRKLYQRGTLDELRKAFPGHTAKAIKSAALARGFLRPAKRYKPTGVSLVDHILERAFDLGYSLFDLDEICQSGRYFRNQSWRNGTAYHGPLLRAVKELGGHIEVAWDDDQYD